MPYVKQDDREQLDPFIDDLLGCFGELEFTPGRLNYILTRLAHGFVEEHGLSYTVINDVAGVFSCAAQEFYRKVGIPYEDLKIKENGDVIPILEKDSE